MEVLAHISAPTSKRDDDRYTAQAIAYLAFEPATVQTSETHVQLPGQPSKAVPEVSEPPKKHLQSGNSWIMKSGFLNASPFHRLEAVHGRWRERSMQQTLKRPLSTASTSALETKNSAKDLESQLRTEIFLDTQSAAAAVESQIDFSLSRGTIASSPLSFNRAIKRQKLSSLHRSSCIQLSSSPQLAGSTPCPSKATATKTNAENGWWSSPDPPISSQLPDSYGFGVSSPTATPSTQRRQSSQGEVDTPVIRRHLPSSGTRTSSALQLSLSSISGLTVHLVTSQQHDQLESSPRTGLWRKPTSSSVAPTASMPNSFVDIVPTLVESGACMLSTRNSVASKIPCGNISEAGGNDIYPTSNRKCGSQALQQVPNHSAASPAPLDAVPPPSNTCRTPIRELNDWNTLPTRIDPGPPEVDCLDWNLRPTHVSTQLSSLSHQSTSQLLRKYQPEYQARELDPWERGYWAFGTAGWNPEIQRSCWDYLTEFVGSGKAGYATRAERTTGSGEIGLGTVTVWCFGDEVKHIYLLLYAASLSRIRNCRAEWRSWNGEVIVRMSSVARLPSKST